MIQFRNFMAGLAVVLAGAGPALSQVTNTDQGAFAPFRYGGLLAPAPRHDRFSHHVVWANSPTRLQVVNAMPSDASSAGRTLWSCAIQEDGHLEDCQLKKSWPAAEGFDRAARSLMPLFQLSAAMTGAAALNQSRVVFEVDVFNDLLIVKNIPGRCPVEFCPTRSPSR